MRLPMPAPDVEELRRREVLGDPDRFLAVLTYDGEDAYLHWDQLRHRPAPPGLTHSQWWLALRMRRLSQARTLPLRQKSGEHFSVVLTDRVLERCEDLTRRLGAHRVDSGAALNRASGANHLVRSLIEEAITSSQLEGASTSRRVAKELLDSGRPPRDVSERMIVNNYAVMEHIRALAHQDLTPEHVLEVHRVVTEGTLADPADAGRLETPDRPRVSVWDNTPEPRPLHVPPPAEELAERLAELCDFANGGSGGPYLPSIVRAVIVHFMVGYDHYFVDGNGRTARALFYWVMLRHGHWLAEFVSISTILRTAPSEYARAYLYAEDDGGDVTYFLHHQLDVLSRAAEAFDAHLERKRREHDAARTGLDELAGELNHRQVDLLRSALRDGSTSAMAVSPLARRFHVSEQTARNDLNDLADRGLLVRRRVGRRHVFHVPGDLGSRLGPPAGGQAG